jgi:hypothetical protein
MQKLLSLILLSLLFTACVPEDLQEKIENNNPLNGPDTVSSTPAPIVDPDHQSSDPINVSGPGSIVIQDDYYTFPITGYPQQYQIIDVLKNDSHELGERLRIVSVDSPDIAEIIEEVINCVVDGPNCNTIYTTLKVQKTCDVEVVYTVEDESGHSDQGSVFLDCATSCNGPCPPGAGS